MLRGFRRYPDAVEFFFRGPRAIVLQHNVQQPSSSDWGEWVVIDDED
jgi:hypothetical protein